VNGSEATALGLDALRAHFRQPGRVDTLVLSHDGKERTVDLRQAALP
jgi:hypothetical protein